MNLENIIVSEVSQREKEKYMISLVSLYSWKESYENLNSVLKSQDITLPTKVQIVKAMVFPAVMYR